jgi:hypothetical protein
MVIVDSSTLIHLSAIIRTEAGFWIEEELYQKALQAAGEWPQP